MDLNCSLSTGMTPHERASLYQTRLFVAIPMMSMGTRKRETIRTVRPDSELTTMHFAPMSMAMPQVAWEMASSRLLILKSDLRKRFS